jgi:hypothetical protein
VGTDEYWIEVSVPVDELKWIDVPGPNDSSRAKALVYHEPGWGKNVSRDGTVARLMAHLEPKGRMARLLVAVKDPLQSPSLILDSYVRVDIQGHEVPGVFKIARTALRDGDRVWIMTEDRTLDIRPVETAWGDSGFVYVSDGLREEELLITSDLGAPVQGMALRTASDEKARPAPEAGSGEDQQRTRGAQRDT